MLTRHGIPQADGIVITPTCKCFTIRTKRNTIDVTCMSSEGVFVLTRHGIPQADGIVRPPAATCQRFAVQAECDARDLSRMPGQQANLLIGLCIVEPNADRTCNRQTRTVRRVDDVTHYAAFTKTSYRTFRQTPLGIVLGTSLGCENR